MGMLERYSRSLKYIIGCKFDDDDDDDDKDGTYEI